MFICYSWFIKHANSSAFRYVFNYHIDVQHVLFIPIILVVIAILETIKKMRRVFENESCSTVTDVLRNKPRNLSLFSLQLLISFANFRIVNFTKRILQYAKKHIRCTDRNPLKSQKKILNDFFLKSQHPKKTISPCSSSNKK